MSLKFEFDSFKGASDFGKNLSRNLRASSRHERDHDKHIIVVPENNLNGVAATTLVVSIVTAGLMSGQHYLDQERFGTVVEAMQRANPELANMTPGQVGEHLSLLSHEQLQGVVNNTKGVYHEMLYVDAVNGAGLETEASIHSEINTPGSDVVFSSEGEVYNEIQLKATDSVSYVNEHLEKYPNIEVLATEEVASKIDGVESSGFSNSVLEQDVSTGFEQLISNADATDTATEAISSAVTDEVIGLGPISLVTGLLFGIF
ncbi:hypothetical protein EXU30_18530 [Shewanella maritima]|uniref:Uncharacterized protein n=1 Tax=Shewanella maritima TaxID=2520507 RepID=A0A411PLQ9_9GAMM|nr:hypothetical protein [Shewanella maritima]QBF84439.1 hypothetical protein EXU30_18530 [Shewanella maritima]